MKIPLQSLFSASGVMLHMDAVREGNGGQFPLVERKNRIFQYLIFFAARICGKDEKPGEKHCSRNGSILYRCDFILWHMFYCLLLVGDTDKGRKLAMAHKNVRFLIMWLFRLLTKMHS